MELFPAMDEEQLAFIKRVIDDCDYYILIIGGRYGSTGPDGVSYTEKEYDYAIEKGLKVLAFLHKDPGKIPMEKSDGDPETLRRLNQFREKVSKGRLVNFWSSAEELPSLVALSLISTIKTYPAVGWVRADQVANLDLLKDLNSLRKRNKELEEVVAKTLTPQERIRVDNLAGLDEEFIIKGTDHYGGETREWDYKITWAGIFAFIAPYLLEHPNDDYVKTILKDAIYKETRRDKKFPSLDDQNFQTVKVQLMALDLVNIQYLKTTTGGVGLFWTLTPKGHATFIRLRTIKKAVRALSTR
jgi:Domain of unknown function (DUF4062)